jgi:hypothetical protein
VLAFSAGGDGGSEPLECDDLERWCGGWALPWHRADLGFFGAHALSRCARVARMDSCGPLLATHFLLEKQVEGASAASVLNGSDPSLWPTVVDPFHGRCIRAAWVKASTATAFLRALRRLA